MKGRETISHVVSSLQGDEDVDTYLGKSGQERVGLLRVTDEAHYVLGFFWRAVHGEIDCSVQHFPTGKKGMTCDQSWNLLSSPLQPWSFRKVNSLIARLYTLISPLQMRKSLQRHRSPLALYIPQTLIQYRLAQLRNMRFVHERTHL